MIRRLLPLLALVMLFLPTAALAVAPTSSVMAAASGSEEDHSEEGAEEDHGEEGAEESGEEDHGEEAEGEHEVELVNMDNGDPADAGAKALVGTPASPFIAIMLYVMGVLVLVLLGFGLVRGRGRNNI